jgi:hypothetical protein
MVDELATKIALGRMSLASVNERIAEEDREMEGA